MRLIILAFETVLR